MFIHGYRGGIWGCCWIITDQTVLNLLIVFKSQEQTLYKQIIVIIEATAVCPEIVILIPK